MDCEVALWQDGVQHDDGEPEQETATHLFEVSTKVLSHLIQAVDSISNDVAVRNYVLLKKEFRKFYLWNMGISTHSGALDQVLSRSKNLKATVFGLLSQWMRSLLKVPAALPEYDWSGALLNLAELDVLAQKADQVAKAAMIDLQLGAVNDDYDSDETSESASSQSDEGLEDVIEDLHCYMESLMDLTPSIERPATDFVTIETPGDNVLLNEFADIPEPARLFAILIKDRFPSMDTTIIKKLGEANWNRREKLRIKLSLAPQIDDVVLSDDDDNRSSTEETIAGPQDRALLDQQPPPSIVHSNYTVTSGYQSTVTASAFSGSSIFDSDPVTITRRPVPLAPQSVTSFATSINDGSDNGLRRIPNLPENHIFGTPFQCQVCGDVQRGIHSRVQWKRHVYDDLEPYICLFTGCNLGLHTFKSRKEWMEHEFLLHRVLAQWHCNLCNDSFSAKEAFRTHLLDSRPKSHVPFTSYSQIEEVVLSSERLVGAKPKSQHCPFCLTVPSETQKGFASHVGKHQQEVSLAALPRLENHWEDESNDGNSDDQDDDADEEHAIRLENKKGKAEMVLPSPGFHATFPNKALDPTQNPDDLLSTFIKTHPGHTVKDMDNFLKKHPILSSQKLLSFSEIQQISNTTTRIEAYISSRRRFAEMDMGLTEWMIRVMERPEHRNELYVRPPRAPDDLVRARSPLQQPYHQEYPEASSSSSSTLRREESITSSKGKDKSARRSFLGFRTQRSRPER